MYIDVHLHDKSDGSVVLSVIDDKLSGVYLQHGTDRYNRAIDKLLDAIDHGAVIAALVRRGLTSATFHGDNGALTGPDDEG